MSRTRSLLLLVLVVLVASSRPAVADGVPIDGFLPLVGISLTDEFDDDLNFFPVPTTGMGGSPLGYGSPHFELALLDTGAAVSLLTSAADNAFNIDGPYPGRSSGFTGTNVIGIGGASGTVDVPVNDPMGLYAAGLQTRVSGGTSLTMNGAVMAGQTNSSLVTLPPESQLPNVLGLSFASQYTTSIRLSDPQVFELEGQTVRAPAVEFHPLGSGGLGIQRTAQLKLLGAGPSTPLYFPDLTGSGGLDLWDNPSQPTLVQGGHFLNVNVQNEGQGFSSDFFFDTGASVTVVSRFKALELGFDAVLDDPEFTISILGSGGTLDDVPGFFVDELTVPALGGSLTVQDVPVIVLDVTNVSSPGNIVDGIIGTNIFYGRDIVIDPNPSLGGGGNPPALYISNPVTTDFDWSTAAASGAWPTAGNWSAAAVPDFLSVVNLDPSGSSDQTATLSTTDAEAFEVNLRGGAASATMTLQLASGSKLTTFAGTNIDDGGILSLDAATLDTQFVDIRNGGVLTGSGMIATGSGQLPGQVENVSGVVAPGAGVGTLNIEGRYASGVGAKLEIDIAGASPGSGYDQLVVDGTVALDGTLEVLLDPGFDPIVGTLFDIIQATEGLGGEFAEFDLPLEYRWGISYTATGVELEVLADNFLGDFNGDGMVDSSDFTVWRDTLGATGSGLAADANSDQIVDADDYALWRSNFGNVQANLDAGQNGVPEPASLLLASAMLLVARLTPLRKVLRASLSAG